MMLWTVVLEKTLESPLDCKKIKLVNPTGNQFWIFTGRINAEAETPILWPHEAKNWRTGKDPYAGKDWRQEKGTTEEWDGWMGSPTRWTWVWANSGRWWRTGKPRVLQPIGLQRVGHNCVTINNSKPLALEFLRWRCSCALFYPMKSCLNINMTHTDIKKKEKVCVYAERHLAYIYSGRTKLALSWQADCAFSLLYPEKEQAPMRDAFQLS